MEQELLEVIKEWGVTVESENPLVLVGEGEDNR
jgi:hypothetical protein